MYPKYSLLQRLNRLDERVLVDDQRLDPGLGDLVQLAGLADVRLGQLVGAELTQADRGPAAVGIVAEAWVAPRAGGEHGLLADRQMGRRHEEDELVALR